MQSMTGFNTFSLNEGADLVWTLKSVNAKGLEVRIKLPLGYEFFEQKIREILKSSFSRGSFYVALEVKEEASNKQNYINLPFLDDLCKTALRIKEKYPDLESAKIDGLLAIKGVVEPINKTSIDTEKTTEILTKSFESGILGLKESRLNEGKKMLECLKYQIEQIEILANEAENLASNQPEKIKETLQKNLLNLKESNEIPEERFMQEVCLLMLKADVQEELDRLKAHCQTAKELFNETSPVGRKLDFLCQEFNREANTLCSKSADISLTKIGLSLKTMIDKLKEQVQNIE